MKIEKTYWLAFPASDVFAAWTSSKTVISPATKMLVEPEVGGRYLLFMEDSETPANQGRFLEVNPGRSLRYSWEWFGDGKVTEITVTFESEGKGTRLRLLHEKFSDDESRTMHDVGWDSYVAGLEAHLSR